MHYADFSNRLLRRLGQPSLFEPTRKQCGQALAEAESETLFEQAGEVSAALMADQSAAIEANLLARYRSHQWLCEAGPLPKVEAVMERLQPWVTREVHFHLLEADGEGASSNVNGAIFLHRGLLAQDENVIAFVVAHEIAHCENRDPLRYRGWKAAAGLLGQVIGYGPARELQEAEMRAREVQADARAKELLEKAGFDLKPVVEWMETWEHDGSLHPAPADRVRALKGS